MDISTGEIPEVNELVDNKETIRQMEQYFAEEMPHVWEEYLQAKEAHSSLVSKAKTALRKSGGGTYCDIKFSVTTRSKTSVDAETIVEIAGERGDVDLLLELGFLKYSVDHGMLERLPPEQAAVYGRYIDKSSGTSSVSIPKWLT